MAGLKVDIAVIGTGAAGMTAALSAAEGGANVILLEKRPAPGGTSNLPRGGILSLETKRQREKITRRQGTRRLRF